MSMGPHLGALYYELFREVILIFYKFEQYSNIFASGEQAIDVLNRAAPTFFFFLEQILFEDILLHLAKLTDPPQTGKRDTLTVARLTAVVDDPALKSELTSLIGSLNEKCDFAREWRNRRVAHLDLSTLREEHPIALPSADQERVKDALSALDVVMNAVSGHYQKSIICFDANIKGGAPQLLERLKKGLRAEDEE